jgi:hypothetical protein
VAKSPLTARCTPLYDSAVALSIFFIKLTVPLEPDGSRLTASKTELAEYDAVATGGLAQIAGLRLRMHWHLLRFS